MDASTTFSYLTKLNISNDTACTLLPSFAHCNMLSFQSTGSSSKRKTMLGRALKKDEFSVHKSTVTQTVNRDRLIALFRRIQKSISQGESQTVSDTASQLSTDDSSVETSVVESLNRSNPEQASPKHSEQSTQKGRKLKKEKSMPELQHSFTNTVTRPPSNFVKRSPIPSPVLSASNKSKVADEEGSSSGSRNDSEKFGEMKLNELKVLAKERGIKGYSKLKKSELIELLRIHV